MEVDVFCLSKLLVLTHRISLHLSDVHGVGPGPGLQQQERLEGEGSSGHQQVRTPHWI